MVSTNLSEDPKSGALFVFSNRRHTRIKILYFDGTGLWVQFQLAEGYPGRKCKAKTSSRSLGDAHRWSGLARSKITSLV